MPPRHSKTYPLLEHGNLFVGQGVGLGDNGDEIDFGMESSHNLNIQGLERVTGGLDEVHASVDAVIDNVHAINLVLRIEIRNEASLDVIHDGAPRLVIVDKVTETRGVDDSQAQTNTVLLDISGDGLDRNGLGNDIERRALLLLRRVERGVEEGIDECGLSEARFT
jgi:hypothetical protein